jgi:predicted MPP superfamily phosphohydrolase
MSKKKWLLLVLSFVAALAADAFWWEPDSFVVHRENLVLPNWHSDLKVAALSDLHVGSLHVGLEKLRSVVEQTNAQKPDVVVLLGDFVVNGPSAIPPEKVAAELKNLRAPLGVYAVLGNHDRWFDGPRVTESLTAAGITVLENRAVRVTNSGRAFWLGGIADLWTSAPEIAGTLKQTNPDEPVILITHNPDVFPDVPSRVSLMIAGHTHGGQVDIPWFGSPVPVSMYDRGHIVEQGRHLFVTIGVGTSGPPARFHATPELVILSLLSGTI